MDEEKLPGSPDSDSDETIRVARELQEEIKSRSFDHTWDVAVPGEEDLPLLPRPESRNSNSEQGEGSEERANEEPEVLIQFENEEENLLSQYDDEDYCEEDYGYEDYDGQYEYDDSYAYDEAYEYEGVYDYEDPYGLNQSMGVTESTDTPDDPTLAGATNLHHMPPQNYWMNNPPPSMIGSMAMQG